MVYIWLSIMVLLLLTELSTTDYTTFWFVISSFVAMVVSIYVDNFSFQLLIFVILGIVLLLVLRPKMVERKRRKLPKGTTGQALNDISSKKHGEIRIGNIIYNAKSKGKIKAGDDVEVVKVLDDIIEVKEISN